jgi:DNA-binding response OmpR family regulator
LAKKILHVDDDEATLRLVARHLKEAGYLVLSTTSPFIAPIIKKEMPDLILMDVEMPLLAGDKIVSIIRGNEFSALPVIYFSARPATELAVIAAKTQPAAYVRKEQGLAELVRKIIAFTS